jgi:hypothetical protein
MISTCGVGRIHQADCRYQRRLQQTHRRFRLCGIKGWKFDHDTFRLTPVLLDGSDRPVMELQEMYERFKIERAREA